jgi:hypothetical protein
VPAQDDSLTAGYDKIFRCLEDPHRMRAALEGDVRRDVYVVRQL